MLKRNDNIKFLGVFEENLKWKDLINTIETNVSRNICFIFRAKHVLNKGSLNELYYSYIHCYINYANIAWGNNYKTQLYKIHLEQKHVIRPICNENKFTNSKPVIQSLRVLNILKKNNRKSLS